jgi:succinate-semialdehyde dehydrogenase/glutarate-semialdehyde dehydrogenase
MDMKTSPLALLKDPTLLKTDGLINGQWVPGSSRFDVLDPATGLKLADVANLGPADAQAAIAAANAAWPAWRGKTAKERSNILRQWFDLLMANQDDLGRLMTAEQGKPLPEAKAKWLMVPASSNGLPKKPSASTGRPCRPSIPRDA